MGQWIGRRRCRAWVGVVVGCGLAASTVTGISGHVVTPAAAQEDTGFSVAYDPLQGPPGTTISITGRCVHHGQPAEHVSTIFYQGDRLIAQVSVPIQADGSFRGALQVPSSEPPGPHTIGSSCFLDDIAIDGFMESPFLVTAPPMTVPSTTAAPPGGSSTTVVPATGSISDATTSSVSDQAASSSAVPPWTATTLAGERVTSSDAGGPLAAWAASALVVGVAAAATGRWWRRHRRPPAP